MQAIVETLFDTVYLASVITIGIIMIIKSGKRKQYRLFGIMAVVLGAGDSFHLVPCAGAVHNGTGKFHWGSWTGKIYYIHHHDSFLCNIILCVAAPV